jgi:hypothetical protein
MISDAQVPYLRDSNHHDFGHYVNKLRFVADAEEGSLGAVSSKEMQSRRKLGIQDPLTGTKAHTEECESADWEE